MLHGICHTRNRILVVFIISLTTLVYFLSVISKYDLTAHKWTYLYFMDLPKRDSEHKGNVVLDHVWQPGPKYALVDPKEPYLKSHHGGKTIKTRNFYQILHYNEEANNHAHVDNAMITDTCAFQNCLFTNNRTLMRNSSAVIFSLSHGKTPIEHVLPRKIPGQVWIFYDREPPIVNAKFFYRHHSWRNSMNWSMSYRLDSDIVYPYGKLSSLPPSELPVKDYSAIFRRKTKLAFWLVSNCDKMVFSARNEYVRELQKHIPIDIYGACGTKVGRDVSHLFEQYKFYLAFENSFCKGYLTEKFFDRFSEDIVLVVRGGVEYDQLFPANTFINAGNFMNAASLAQHIRRIGESEELYTSRLKSKDEYVFSGTLNWQCQMCAKLNDQERFQRVYDSVVSFWNTNACWKATDISVEWRTYYVILASLIVVLVLLQCFLFKHRGLRNRIFDSFHSINNWRIRKL